jgi:hypothetical protein
MRTIAIQVVPESDPSLWVKRLTESYTIQKNAKN